MKGKLGRYLGLDEHLALGVNIAWYPGFTHHVTWAALWDFMTAFESRRREGLGGLCREPPRSALSRARGAGRRRRRTPSSRTLEQRYFSSGDRRQRS